MLELFSPRRISVPDFRHFRHRVICGSAMRYAQRPRKLTPAEESAIRTLGGTKSLRSLAADFGVSHETVRSAICQGRTGCRE